MFLFLYIYIDKKAKAAIVRKIDNVSENKKMEELVRLPTNPKLSNQNSKTKQKHHLRTTTKHASNLED